MVLTLQNICGMTEKPFVSADAKTRAVTRLLWQLTNGFSD